MARQQRICWTMLLLLSASLAHAQDSAPLDLTGANWIWAAAEPTTGEALVFRRSFDLGAPAVFGRVLVTAVPGYELYLNGARLGGDSDWMEPETFDVAQRLVAGRNTLAVKVPRGGPNPGLLLAFRGVDGDGRVVDLRSDADWRQALDPAEGWEQTATDTAGWSAAAVKGVYGDAPWGRLTRMSQAETVRAMSEVRIDLAPETAQHPANSVFAGDYLAEELPARYRDYVGVDRATGRFTVGATRQPMMFVRYRQRGGVTTFESLDLGLLESDLELMANNGLDLALDGFGWGDLLNEDGTWRRVDRQPIGAPATFEYRYQILDHLLNRIQAHGLHAIALLDYRQPLPSALLPETYRDKVMLSDSIWRGVGDGQAKIVRYFANRSVLVGYALATDALPPLPAADEPLLHDVYADFLSRRHGSIEALRQAWGVSGYGSFRDVPLPSGEADDPSAVDYRAMVEDLTVSRLNQWVDQLRAVDPHHVFALGLAEPTCPPAAAAQLRFDLLGTFAYDPAPTETTEWMPGYGQILAPINGYRARSGGIIAGLLGGRYGGGQRGGHAARLVRQEWAELAGSGAAGMIAAPPWDELVRRGAAGSIDIVSLTSLGSLVNASRADFPPVAPEVLLVGDETCVDPRDEESVRRVAESLDREHFVYDILPPSALLGADPNADWLNDYRIVIMPSLRRVVDLGLWDRLHTWVQDGAEPRLLVLGRWAETNAYGRPGGLPQGLAELTGGARPADGAGRVLMIGRPLSPLPTGKRIDWPLGVPAGLSVGAGGEVVGWLRPTATTTEGTAALVRRQVGSGAVLLAGFDLGAGDAAAPAGWYSAVGDLLRLALGEVGVQAEYAAPANVDTAVSTDGRTILTRERLGESAEVIWAGSALAEQPVWSVATLAIDPSRRLTVRLPLAPYQVTPLQAVGTLGGLGDGQAASIRVGHREGMPLTIDAEGPAEMNVRLWLDPNRSYEVRRPGPALRTLTPDARGVLEVPVTGGMTQVSVLPPRVAGGVSSPSEYLTVGEYYESRGEFGRALREYERLEQQYAGTEVARQAAAKREGLLLQSGVIVVANQSRVPLDVRYVGPSSTEGTVEPGASQAFVLRAGQYREILQPSSSMMLAVATPEPELVTVAQGEAVVREYGIPLRGQPEVFDPDANVRGRLSEAEKTALMDQAKANLPTPPEPAQEGGQDGEETLTGPELNIALDKEVVTPQEETGKTEFNIRNLTSYPIEITVTHYVVGVRPESATIELKPRGRAALEFSEPGTYDVGGLVLTNNQRLVFGQFGNDGLKYYYEIDELTEKDIERREKAQRRKLIKAGR